MNLSAPQPLGAHHRLEAFDCGKPALTDWLHRHARQAQGSGSARTAVRRTLSIAEQAGIRALLTHPIDTSADAFYRRFGFEPTPEIERQLILLLKDARRFVS